MQILSYRVLLRKEPESGYTVLVPALPGCITYGADNPEAIAMAREAIELYIESLTAHGEEVPTMALRRAMVRPHRSSETCEVLGSRRHPADG